MPKKPRKKKAKLQQEQVELEDIFAASGAEVDEEIAKWESWRQEVPTRKPNGTKIIREAYLRPINKSEQDAWHYYTDPGTRQSWIFVPFLEKAQDSSAQPLAGAPLEANLFQCTVKGELLQHYSNIHRVSHLASTHPLVRSVIPHKIEKAADPSQFDATGRRTKYHQSPWDLDITLAGTGLRMHLGCTVNNIKSDLVAFWWQPVYAGWSKKFLSIGESIFFDLVEVDHLALTVRGNVLGIAAEDKTIPASGGLASTSQPSSSSNAEVLATTRKPDEPAETKAASSADDAQMDATPPKPDQEIPLPLTPKPDPPVAATTPFELAGEQESKEEDAKRIPVATTSAQDEDMPAPSPAQSISASGEQIDKRPQVELVKRVQLVKRVHTLTLTPRLDSSDTEDATVPPEMPTLATEETGTYQGEYSVNYDPDDDSSEDMGPRRASAPPLTWEPWGILSLIPRTFLRI